MATNIEASALLRDISPAYVVDNGPIMFHAQKLMVETHVARTRFVPCRAPIPGAVCTTSWPGCQAPSAASWGSRLQRVRGRDSVSQAGALQA